MNQTSGSKSFEISKHLVFEAYLRVKANKGAAGVDGESMLTATGDADLALDSRH